MNLPTESSVAEEIANKVDDLTLNLSPLRALQLVGLLQLALRHPSLIDSETDIIGHLIVAHTRTYFEDCPAVLALIECGEDSRFDVR